jgi:antibiotic biosynthesis monooxygenase (ABM) superfamily enzyme
MGVTRARLTTGRARERSAAMVLAVVKWDIHPDKTDAYLKWVPSAIQRDLAVPGVVEFRAYRMFVGSQQIVTTFEFADIAAWAAWQASAQVQQVLSELRTLALNVTSEVWGPSPVVPAPVRPGK